MREEQNLSVVRLLTRAVLCLGRVGTEGLLRPLVVEALPDEDKRAFTAEFLRRSIPYESGPLDDEEIAHTADQLFDHVQ